MGCAILLGVIGAVYYLVWQNCLKQTDGHFTYVLDDPYIHLAIAKNLAQHGIWGVTQYSFSSASSSPLWTVFLGLVERIEGDSVFWPLIFSVIFSSATAVLLYFRFVRAKFGLVFAVVGALVVFAAGPLHVLPFTGMEHCMQILLDVVFGFWLLDKMGRPSETKDLPVAALLTTLVCSCRYEGVFLVVVPVVVCLWRRDWRLASALAVGPVLAVGGFALYSHSVGMPLIPNSISLKGHFPSVGAVAYVRDLVLAAYSALHFGSGTHADLFVICVIAVLAMRLRALRTATSSLQIWMWTLVVAGALHAGFATFGWFFRYEAYLVVSMTTVIILAFREFLAQEAATGPAPVSTVIWMLGIGLVTVIQAVMHRFGWVYRSDSSAILSTNLVALTLLVLMFVGPKTRDRLTKSMVGVLVPIVVIVSIWDRASYSYSVVGNGSRDIYLQQIQMSRFISRYYMRGRLAANDIGAVTYFTDVHLFDIWGLANDEVRRLRVARQYSTKTLGPMLDTFKPDLVIAYPQWYSGRTRFPSSYIPMAAWVIPATITAAFPNVMFYAPNATAAKRLQRELREFTTSLPPQVKVQIRSGL